MRAAAVAFLCGILLLQQCAALPSLVWALALVPALGLALWQPRWSIVAFVVAGFAWAALRADLILQQQLPPRLEARDMRVEGVVADLPRATEYGWRFLFDVDAARVDGRAVPIPRLRLSAGHGIAPQAGERWRFTVRLKRPHGLMNPGGFDYEAYLLRQRVRAIGYVREMPEPAYLGEAGGLYRINRWRQMLGNRMGALMPQARHAGLIVALANGDGSGISDGQWRTLRRTGTIHLVAISGLHISLIAGLAYWLLSRLWALSSAAVLRVPAPLAGAAGGLIAAAAYAALAGFVIPTQRALIMVAVALGAALARRRVAPSYLLPAALLAVLLYDPLSVMAPGFWLSFAAVAVIVYVMYGERRARWRRLAWLQLAIGLGLFPLMLWLFQQTSLVAPLANLLAVPAFELLLVPLSLLGAGAVGLGLTSAAAWVFRGADALLGWLWSPLGWLAALDHAEWVQPAPGVWAFAAALVGVALLLAPRAWPGRALGAVWLLPLLLTRPAAPAPGELWFTLLDVGQGLAAVARTAHHVLVYDAGPRWSARADAGDSVVLPYLRTQGVAAIDTLIVSHGDNDHAGGVEAVRAALPVARVLTGAPEIAGESCRRGQRWRWDGVEFAVLGPSGSAHNTNDASCVLRIAAAGARVLVPGDIERTGEARLLADDARALSADILVAPHHGSRSSSSPAFVAAVNPRHVAFAVGYRNRYRHPHPVVAARYRAYGSRLYASPATGALEFRLGAGGVETRAFRERARRYWFAEVASP